MEHNEIEVDEPGEQSMSGMISKPFHPVLQSVVVLTLTAALVAIAGYVVWRIVRQLFR